MPLPLTGFREVRLVRTSRRTRVYEALRNADGRAVIVKVCEFGGEDIESRVEHEFAQLVALDIEGVVRALDLQRVGERWVLVFERFPGVDLRSHAEGQPLGIDEFLAIAIPLVDILARVHERRIIHGDLKPACMLVDTDTGRVRLADFGLSTLLELERQHIYDPEVLADVLPYLSPEQTGRTGRAPDSRSDLYSLGVTFYELLTGRRPFVYAEPLELIHAHLARVPDPPRSLRPDLPEGLERIVLELLAKPPEHRYQSARGLVADLRRLRDQLASDEPEPSFELGGEDIVRELQLPHQLYGRESERSTIIAELAQVVRTGRARIVLLSGPAGIGKSALIADVESEVARFQGHVARGRFDPARDRPYSAFIEAFTGLVEQLLTESEQRLDHWREQLRQALGGIGRVVTELVPTLELILGVQPSLAQLEPLEARNRVQLAFSRFLSVFCEEPNSLVLVLEDLQWSDHSSISLLESLSDASRRGGLLVLGSFRAHEVGELHPLRALIARLPDTRIEIVELGPLSADAVGQLLADSLARTPAEVGRLTALVARKTDNNPLFIRQLLVHLAKRELMRPSERGWTWDDDAIESAGVPDDVLGVMNAKLAALPSDARELIRRAACIGDRFDLAGLKVVLDQPGSTLTATLYDLVYAGLISHSGRHAGHASGHVGGEYRFAHHGIREAALAGADVELRQRLRWQVGQHWLSVVDPGTSERLFEIVDHLDAGLASAELTPLARAELAELNLRAGQRALDSAAHEAALRYLEQGIELITKPQESVVGAGPLDPLLVDLHFARAKALAVRAGAKAAEPAFKALLAWPLRPRDHGRVAARWIAQLTLEGRTREAVEFGLAGLARLGWASARSPSRASMWITLAWTWQRVRDLDGERLIAMPRCGDESASAAMQILAPTKNAAYVVDSRLYVVLVCLHVRGLVRHGDHPGAALALAQLATCVGARLGQVAGAIGLCNAALALSERFDPGPTRVRVEAAADLFVSHLGRPFAEPLARLDGVYARALEAGDFLWAGYAGALALSMQLEVGTHLRVLRRLSERFESELGTRATREIQIVAASVRALAIALAPEHDDAQAEALASLDPERLGPVSQYSRYVTLANRALAALLLGKPRAALDSCLEMIQAIEQVLFASWVIPRVALITLVAADMLRPTRRKPSGLPTGSADACRKARATLRRWASRSSENYRHYFDLAEGLRAAERGHLGAALGRIERARAHAARQGCRWVEGLAAERLAAIAERSDLSGLGIGARRQAASAYAAWGASAKLAEFSLPELDEASIAPADRRSERRGFAGIGALDFDSVLRSVAAIGADLRLDQVITSVLDAAITNAGADHGMLVLEREGVLGIVAMAEIDGERVVLAKPLALDEAEDRAPTSVIHFVLRTEQALVLDDVAADARFADDPYLGAARVRSLLGMPILKGRRTLGALVLENRLSSHGFTPDRLEVLQLIAGQAASALDHARVHDALREGEARWRSLVAGAPDVIALLDERGDIEFINRRLSASDRELFATSPAFAPWRAAADEVLREGSTIELELELPRASGPARWFVARLAPIELEHERDDSGTAPRLRKAIAIATDISARKRAEADKRALEATLRQQQRLESIGTLAAGVAHEINNPIQGIMNYAELIVSSPGNHALIEEFAAEITSESNRVATIVRNLLAFSRHEGELPVTNSDLGRLVEATLSLIHAVMRKDQIEIRLGLPPGLPPARCQPQQIQQIIMNLVTNARDALDPGETGARPDAPRWIEIRVEALERPEAKPRHWLRLTVEDPGPGIRPEVLAHIFDPFFTTKGRDRGTGLGLSVSHGIAREHGGDLTVDSRVGEGTRFFLDLPANELPAIDLPAKVGPSD